MSDSTRELLEQRSAIYRLRADLAAQSAAKAKHPEIARAYSALAAAWTKLADSIDSGGPRTQTPHPEPKKQQAA